VVQSAHLVAPCGVKIDNARPIAEIFPLGVGFVVVHFFQKFGLRQVLRLCAGNEDTNFCAVEQLFAQKSKKNRNFASNFYRK